MSRDLSFLVNLFMMTDSINLPPAIRDLFSQVLPNQGERTEELLTASAKHAEKVKISAPYAFVSGDGETIATGALSPGCQACKAGTWDCLFLTMDCNLSCSFCCSPGDRRRNVPLSAFGNDVEELLFHYRLIQPEGISFSGGEVFLDIDRLRTMIALMRREFPFAYLWVYTNGFLANPEISRELGQLGLDEIRFNLAASGYNHPKILHHVEQAGKWIGAVSVEIPAIPDHTRKILSALGDWNNAGVRYINLHELMYEPGSFSEHLPGPRLTVRTADGHQTAVHPGSRELTLQVMQEVHSSRWAMGVNDCSLHNKLRQVRGRRKLVGRLVENLPCSVEMLCSDGMLETICAYQPTGEYLMVHPNRLEQALSEYPDYHFVRLRRIPPLSMNTPRRWDEVVEIR